MLENFIGEEIIQMIRYDPAILFHKMSCPNDQKCKSFLLHWACRKGHVDVVKVLLQVPWIDPNSRDANGSNAVQIACQAGVLEIYQPLVQDSRVPAFGVYHHHMEFDFYCACQGGSLAIVELFLQDSRVDPSVDDNAAFVEACEYGHADIAQLLLQDPRVDSSAFE